MNTLKIVALLLLGGWVLSCTRNINPVETIDKFPDIFPDYVGVTVPASIAPLNFRLNGEIQECVAKISGEKGASIRIKGQKKIIIPEGKWKQLLRLNEGGKIEITVLARINGNWIKYAPFVVWVSNISIDYGLVYRLIAPGYEVYSKMGIYQRRLDDFTQLAVVENTLLPGSCVNCHALRLTDPEDFTFHLRGSNGGTVLHTKAETKLLNTKTPNTMSNFVYPFWHPSGDYISYSVNKTKQVFHEQKDKRVEVIDAASDIIVYDVNTNEVLCCDQLMKESVFETYPSFSPDGRWLYFCASKAKKIPNDYKKVRYNLCRIAFDPETGLFGKKIDTLFYASENGKSVTFPRPSPDGKYILFTLIDYGNFSIWHKEADLYLLNLQTNEIRPLKNVNSPETESYHAWSSNSQWVVFSSRRLNGLYTHLFIAHIDENGNCSKPFLLPQKDPDIYDEQLYSFNIPEFINKKIELSGREIEQLNPEEVQYLPRE